MHDISNKMRCRNVCTVYLFASLPFTSYGQGQCSVTNPTVVVITSSCGSSQWTVKATETSGPHKGTITIGATNAPNSIKGVCAYDYPGCVQNKYFDESAQLPTAMAKVQSVSGSSMSVTVTITTPTLTADPHACNCDDANPRGYNGITSSTPLITQTVYGSC